jgi:hypothetical protein
MADLDTYVFVRRRGSLFPGDLHAEDMLSSIGEGRAVLVSIRRARSVRHHRLFWALLHKVVDNSEKWSSEEELLQDLKLAVGHVDKRANLMTGEVMAIPRSINFASMDQEAFKRFWRRCVYVLATQVLNVLPADLEREIMEMIGE